jgi:hypothetical protein
MYTISYILFLFSIIICAYHNTALSQKINHCNNYSNDLFDCITKTNHKCTFDKILKCHEGIPTCHILPNDATICKSLSSYIPGGCVFQNHRCVTQQQLPKATHSVHIQSTNNNNNNNNNNDNVPSGFQDNYMCSRSRGCDYTQLQDNNLHYIGTAIVTSTNINNANIYATYNLTLNPYGFSEYDNNNISNQQLFNTNAVFYSDLYGIIHSNGIIDTFQFQPISSETIMNENLQFSSTKSFNYMDEFQQEFTVLLTTIATPYYNLPSIFFGFDGTTSNITQLSVHTDVANDDIVIVDTLSACTYTNDGFCNSIQTYVSNICSRTGTTLTNFVTNITKTHLYVRYNSNINYINMASCDYNIFENKVLYDALQSTISTQYNQQILNFNFNFIIEQYSSTGNGGGSDGMNVLHFKKHAVKQFDTTTDLFTISSISGPNLVSYYYTSIVPDPIVTSIETDKNLTSESNLFLEELIQTCPTANEIQNPNFVVWYEIDGIRSTRQPASYIFEYAAFYSRLLCDGNLFPFDTFLDFRQYMYTTRSLTWGGVILVNLFRILSLLMNITFGQVFLTWFLYSIVFFGNLANLFLIIFWNGDVITAVFKYQTFAFLNDMTISMIIVMETLNVIKYITRSSTFTSKTHASMVHYSLIALLIFIQSLNWDGETIPGVLEVTKDLDIQLLLVIATTFILFSIFAVPSLLNYFLSAYYKSVQKWTRITCSFFIMSAAVLLITLPLSTYSYAIPYSFITDGFRKTFFFYILLECMLLVELLFVCYTIIVHYGTVTNNTTILTSDNNNIDMNIKNTTSASISNNTIYAKLRQMHIKK